MDNHFSAAKLFSRREILALAAGIGAAAALRFAPVFAAAGPLLTRPIPRTGERLPIVGLGTAIIFDFDSSSDAAKRAARRAVIRTMIDGGGRLIDTAPSYGRAESTVGDLLSETGVRDKIFLATKVRATNSREACTAEMQESLKRLRTNKIDLMQIHNVGGRDRGETVAQLALLHEWKERGVFRYIGVTHSQDQEAANDWLIDLMRREKLDFMQVNYSMAERSVEQRLLAVATETGTAVLVNLPFARGRLFRAVQGKRMPAWAAEFDAASWGQFFLKYILAQEAVTCVMPGTDKPEYMVDNLNAGRGRLPDAAQRKKMVEFWKSLAA
jgi:aryl-alcohol dehydrogenase-like predicted oxidoreductase